MCKVLKIIFKIRYRNGQYIKTVINVVGYYGNKYLNYILILFKISYNEYNQKDWEY